MAQQNVNGDNVLNPVDINPFLRSPEGEPNGLHREIDLPSYEEVVNETNEPPPSYESLFSRLKEAGKSGERMYDILKYILIFITGWSTIPVGMIVVGLIYMSQDQCPKEKWIPAYVIVGSSLCLLKAVLYAFLQVRKRIEGTPAERARNITMLTGFILGWFILGSVLMNKLDKLNGQHLSQGLYCGETYLFAYWLITYVYICLQACICRKK